MLSANAETGQLRLPVDELSACCHREKHAVGEIQIASYAADLTNSEWALFEPMLPKLKPTGLVPPMPWALVRALRFCANVQGRQLS